MAYTVKTVAEMASVSIRTLHHYDHIGLLRPASVSVAGYRLYAEADLERLQQVLFFRELGDLYVDDSRFTAHYDQIRPGLARFMRAAMHTYYDRRAGKH